MIKVFLRLYMYADKSYGQSGKKIIRYAVKLSFKFLKHQRQSIKIH